jgi:hypothetical protein
MCKSRTGVDLGIFLVVLRTLFLNATNYQQDKHKSLLIVSVTYGELV